MKRTEYFVIKILIVLCNVMKNDTRMRNFSCRRNDGYCYTDELDSVDFDSVIIIQINI